MKRTNMIQNIPDWIADELREEILNNIVKAGEPLKQQEIGKRFDVSMIPVREALRKLESEGLVIVYPNRGAFVSALSIESIEEIFETRIILETGAMERVLPLMTEECLRKAEAILDVLDQAKTGNELSKLNQEFHSLLFSPLNNIFLSDLLRTLHVNIERYMRYYLLEESHQAVSQEHHRKILCAMRKKDVNEAKRLLEEHMRKALSDLAQSMSMAG